MSPRLPAAVSLLGYREGPATCNIEMLANVLTLCHAILHVGTFVASLDDVEPIKYVVASS